MAGYGNHGYSGNFSWNGSDNINTSGPAPATVLTLSGLPEHTSLDLNFLLAIIDSWDGSSFIGEPGQAPDFFNVAIDGVLFFSETFDNNTNFWNGLPVYDPSYIPPDGVLLVDRQNMGIGHTSQQGFWESGFNMGLDPFFDAIPHTGSTLTIEWFASGRGWLGNVGGDESWAIENVEIRLNRPSVVPEPLTIILWGFGVLGFAGNMCRRNRRKVPISAFL